MTTAAIATEIHQSLDIHGNFPTPVTFNDIIAFDDLSDSGYILSVEIITVHLIGKIGFIKNFPGSGQSDSINVG